MCGIDCFFMWGDIILCETVLWVEFKFCSKNALNTVKIYFMKIVLIFFKIRSSLMAGGVRQGVINPWLVEEPEETRGLGFHEIQQQQRRIIEGKANFSVLGLQSIPVPVHRYHWNLITCFPNQPGSKTSCIKWGSPSNFPAILLLYCLEMVLHVFTCLYLITQYV